MTANMDDQIVGLTIGAAAMAITIHPSQLDAR